MTSCSASSASAFPEAPSSPSGATAATRSPRPLRCARGKTPAHWTQRQRRGSLLVSLAGAMGCYWALRAHHSTHRRGPPLHRAGGYLLGAVLTLPSLEKAESRAKGVGFIVPGPSPDRRPIGRKQLPRIEEGRP